MRMLAVFPCVVSPIELFRVLRHFEIHEMWVGNVLWSWESLQELVRWVTLAKIPTQRTKVIINRPWKIEDWNYLYNQIQIPLITFSEKIDFKNITSSAARSNFWKPEFLIQIERCENLHFFVHHKIFSVFDFIFFLLNLNWKITNHIFRNSISIHHLSSLEWEWYQFEKPRHLRLTRSLILSYIFRLHSSWNVSQNDETCLSVRKK